MIQTTKHIGKKLGWKATFPVELPLYCAVLTSAAGAVCNRLHQLCLF